MPYLYSLLILLPDITTCILSQSSSSAEQNVRRIILVNELIDGGQVKLFYFHRDVLQQALI